MIGQENVEWIKTESPISVRLTVGEIRIAHYFIPGLRCMPNIFSTSPLSSLHPPIAAMRKEGVDIARAHSYPLKVGVSRIAIKNSCLCYIDNIYKYYYVDISGNFDNFLKEKKKFIKDIKRCIRKIEAISNGFPIFEIYSSPEEIDIFFKLAISISKKTYQHLLLKEGIPDNEEFKKIAIEKSKKGEFFGYILRINNIPVAYNVCPVYDRDKVLYDYSGYDPKYKEYSPGTVLHFKVIENMFNRSGLNYYDLCTGDGIHKKMFSTGFVLCGDIYYCSLFSRYIIIIIVKILLKFGVDVTKAILTYFSLKEIVKKNIRKFALIIRR